MTLFDTHVPRGTDKHDLTKIRRSAGGTAARNLEAMVHRVINRGLLLKLLGPSQWRRAGWRSMRGSVSP